MPIDRTRWREELSKRYSANPACRCICVDDGWKDIICDLYDELEKLGIKYEIAQIKEKLGGLRFYVDIEGERTPLRVDMQSPQGVTSGYTQDLSEKRKKFQALINEAEKKSRAVCEMCGAPGTLCGTSYVRTLCEKCEVLWQADRAANA